MTDAALLAHITRLPHGRANFKQLVRELSAKGEARAELETALDRLADRGDVVELRSGNYVATSKSHEFISGRIHIHRDGYGFVTPDRAISNLTGDIYIPAASAQSAMHGDRVLAKVLRIEQGGRADGEILKVLRRAHPTVVGEFHVRRQGNFVAPHDERIREWITIPEGMEIPAAGKPIDRVGVEPIVIKDVSDLDGLIVNVELLEYPEGDDPAVGRVME